MNRKTRKKYNGIVRAAKLLGFFGLLLIMFFIGLLWFARPKESVIEKRTLTTFPKFTVSSFLSGEFFTDVDTWYSDTYPLRELLISGSQSMQNHYGIRGEQIVGDAQQVADAIPTGDAAILDDDSEETETAETEAVETEAVETEDAGGEGTVTDIGEMAGNIYITDNCGYGLYYFTESGANSYIKCMNDIYDNIGDICNMYVMVCPISAGVMLDQSVLDDMGCSNEGDAINYIYNNLDSGIHPISIYNNLVKHNDEYIYFHTDHHWTQLGAYYAYEVFCEEKGTTPNPLDSFETRSYDGFLGTFYSSSNNSAALASNPDTVECYVPNSTNDMTMNMQDGSVVDWKVIMDVSDYDKTQLYAAFVGGDRPFSYTHNETKSDGSACMVIKDSYGNAFIPWLVDDYEYVYWVDYRYTTNTVSQMVQDYGVTDVIFESSIYNASTDNMVSEFRSIGQ